MHKKILIISTTSSATCRVIGESEGVPTETDSQIPVKGNGSFCKVTNVTDLRYPFVNFRRHG